MSPAPAGWVVEEGGAEKRGVQIPCPEAAAALLSDQWHSYGGSLNYESWRECEGVGCEADYEAPLAIPHRNGRCVDPVQNREHPAHHFEGHSDDLMKIVRGAA